MAVGGGYKLVAPCALLDKVSFSVRGKNNVVIFDDFSRLRNCVISIRGNNNLIHVGSWCGLNQVEFCVEDDNNEIVIGDHTGIHGKTHLAAIEGTKIHIGKDCMFSSDIHFRTGDSHSIVDLSGKRINESKDIVIGNHVWVGTKVTCLKGAVVPEHSIVGACSLVTGKHSVPNCVVAGVPAKIVKKDVDWSSARVPVGEIPSDFLATKT